MAHLITVRLSKVATVALLGDMGKGVPRCPPAMSALRLPLVAALARASMEGTGQERKDYEDTRY